MARTKSNESIWRKLKGRCLYLLVSLLLLLFLYPVFHDGPYDAVVMLIMNSVTLVAGVYAVSEKRWHIAIAVAMAAPQILTASLAFWLAGRSPWAATAANLSSVLLIVFYVFTLLLVFRYVVQTGPVTSDRLYGAVSVYLVMGLAWAAGYNLIERIHPGSFAASYGKLDFIYYSFVTLTTLGYGDIVPITPHARSVAILESISGVLFMAITIARLVSLYQPKRRSGSD